MNKTKVFVAKTLVEDIDLNSCYAEVFDTYEKAKAYADREITYYVNNYNGVLIKNYSHRMLMQSGDIYVEVEIVETKIK